jgi:signal transduction histidine kinase
VVEDILINAELNRTYALDSFENYNVLDLITDVINKNKYLADQKDVSITYSVSPDIPVPMSRLYANQVFLNLVNNAVKFNYPKGRVNISVIAGKEEVKIIISDTDIGIKP